jgi:glucose-6-phosphate 1-dehydrogenase
MANSNIAIIILGSSGDLTKRKLIPALNRLFELHEFDRSCRIIGSGRTDLTTEQFRNLFDVSDEFKKLLFYHRGISGLKEFLLSGGSFSRIIIFMALPPEVYVSTAKELHEEGFHEESSIIIEKPFGYDYDSSVKLNGELSRYFSESQIYRNDHYLAKEAVQNILVFRFANMLFQSVWNSQNIESIQISATETQGIGSRGPYFDKAGIIRDMAQNHLMQLLTLLTMEPPVSLQPEDISSRKTDVLRSVSVDQCFRYQYEGYREEKGVSSQSTTETYAELQLSINNFRWAGMPIYLRCGKALDRTGTEISVKFKSPPQYLFNEKGTLPNNAIIFKIQPAEGIIMSMSSKEPGNDIKMSPTNMKFCYHDSFNGQLAEAYERILLDVIRGDHTLFVTAQETENLWKLFEPVLDKGKIIEYRKGEMPQSAFNIKWADFAQYNKICVQKEFTSESQG